MSSHGGWTPEETWLATEMAWRGLVVKVDKGPPRRAALAEEKKPADTCWVERLSGGEEASLLLHFKGERAWVALEQVDGGVGYWRDGWLLVLWRAEGGRWVLAPGDRIAEIDRAWLGPIRGRLVRKSLTLEARGASGSIEVPLPDRAFHRRTRQSSTLWQPDRSIGWAYSTEVEPEPFWRIDLERSYFIPRLRIALCGVMPGAELKLRGCSMLSPFDEVPPGSLRTRVALAPGGGKQRVDVELGWVARHLQFELTGAQNEPLSLEVEGCEIPGAELHGATLRESYRQAFAVFQERTLVEERRGEGYEPALTYGEVDRRAHRLARALAARLEPGRRGRVFFALITRNRPEWIIADLAAIERGYAVAPLSPDEPDDRLLSILGRVQPAAVLIEEGQEARFVALARQVQSIELLVACGPVAGASERPALVSVDSLIDEGGRVEAPGPAEYDQQELYSLLFTSGSTGAPKGVMRSYASFFAMIKSFGVPQPARHLSFMPLSHSSERSYLPAIFLHGGAVAFSQGGARLPGELRAFEPTELGSVPRLFDLLHAAHQRNLGEGKSPREAWEEARFAYGNRLEVISVGSAPVRPEVLEFLKKTFADIWMIEGYGATEVSAIASDGEPGHDVEIKIVPLAGGAPSGVERGELLVRTGYMASGYFGDPEATAAAFDAEGFYRTGDLVERLPSGKIRVIGRVKSAVKLAGGEFVSAERVEAALGSSPLVDRVAALAEPGAEGVSVLVFADRGALAGLLGAGDEPLAELVRRPGAASAALAELVRHGAAAGLLPHELPREALLDPEEPTVERGLLTASGKLARPGLGRRLAELRGQRRPSSDDPLARAAGAALGRPVSLDEPLGAFDSLAAAALLSALSSTLGREIPLDAWFASETLGGLIERLSSGQGGASALEQQARAELQRPLVFSPPKGEPRRPARSVLLTGATGFLGIHLLEQLGRAGVEARCLVRARDNAHARERILEASRRFGCAIDEGRLIASAADLSLPRLGLGDEGFEALAGAVDAVVHAGAEVSWLMPFARLRGANVGGTRSLIELCSRGRPKRLHLVSTISAAPVGGDEDSSLTLAQAASSPYALSKWLSERLALEARARGLALTLYRPAMIAPHSQRGLLNPGDFTARYLEGCRELGLYIDDERERLDMTPVDHVAGAIAALLDRAPGRGEVYHLVNVDQSMTYAALGRAMAAAGLGVRPASYWRFREALLGQQGERGRRLRELAAFFPEAGLGLGMGPWGAARSRAELAGLGVTCPAIDQGYIERAAKPR